MPTAGATVSRGQLTSNTLKVYNTSYRVSYAERVHGEGDVILISRERMNRLIMNNKIKCLSVVDSPMVNFTSYLGHSSGSGFTANQRPAIYYRPSLDHTDNPQFG